MVLVQCMVQAGTAYYKWVSLTLTGGYGSKEWHQSYLYWLLKCKPKYIPLPNSYDPKSRQANSKSGYKSLTLKVWALLKSWCNLLTNLWCKKNKVSGHFFLQRLSHLWLQYHSPKKLIKVLWVQWNLTELWTFKHQNLHTVYVVVRP